MLPVELVTLGATSAQSVLLRACQECFGRNREKKREAAADVYLQHNIRTGDMELKASYSSGFI